MAADSDGCILTTIVTCEGNLGDPDFPVRLNRVISSLNGILGKVVKVRKLEPWNSVRVTLSIPREAALRLRQLANEGSHLLKALGILSVQVEGDQVISLRIASGPLGSEPQEIILRTSQDGQGTSSSNAPVGRSDLEEPLVRLFSGNNTVGAVSISSNSTVASEKVQFKSPNVVCPADSVVPKVAVSNSPTPSKNPFPFTSMNQAIHSREVSHQHQQQNSSVPLATVPLPTVPIPVAAVPVPTVPSIPPPPYPSQNPPVSISSPLLVNLLQNDGPDVLSVPPATTSAVKFKCPRTLTSNNNSAVVNLPQTNSNNNNLSVNSNLSPSALSNKHQTISTTPCALNISASQPPPLNNISISRPAPPLLPPPPYPSTWASPTHLPDITPSFTDLKADDLDQLLPSLEHDLVHSPPDLPEILTNTNHNDHLDSIGTNQILEAAGKNFLINPLTGELEPQSSGESEVEDEVRDVFTDLPSPAAPFSDEDTSSTSKTDNLVNNITDQSDSDTRSSLIETSVKHRYKNVKTSKEKGRDSPSLKPTEKIKLRLKLEKSEPVNAAYKVDVSFINTQQPKKAVVASVAPSPPPHTPSSEGLRVPPLHISLRGRNLVITNKKRNKLLGEGGEKLKVRKTQDYALKRKEDLSPMGEDNVNICVPALIDASSDQVRMRSSSSDSKKIKKPKLNHENKEGLHSAPQLLSQDTKVVLHNYQMKEKQKERRGSDSELSKSSKKILDSNGIISEEKKRRLSQSDSVESTEILGSTNIGTMVGLPKPRKEKVKNREVNRNKNYSKTFAEKLAKQQLIALPTGEIDMEAKFKQRLLEGVNRSPHRTEQTAPAPEKPPPVEEKLPEPDKCNTPERKAEIGEKPVAGRSPNSGAQGEDSGIESMDALSEKSPNQASQSPHADLPESALKSKTQVPDMMDIEAQLAKMEGLNGGDECCISSALQDSLKQGTVSLSVHSNDSNSSPKEIKSYNEDEVSLTPTNVDNSTPNINKEEDLEPLPLRVAPPLYTYSNPEKSRDSEENYGEELENNSGQNTLKNKSLLEALLIEIPADQHHNSDSGSPATRSVRTRASSKLNSPDINLNSPVSKQQRAPTPANKRKRLESDSSNHAVEELRKKTRGTIDNIDMKQVGTEQITPKINSVKKAISGGNLTPGIKNDDESSDSDEPLIEKMRKSNNPHPVVITTSISNINSSIPAAMTNAITSITSTSNKTKVKPTVTLAKSIIMSNAPLSTRRSVRSAMPAQNTRSKGDMKIHVDGTTAAADAVRRKTRSAVVDLDIKRKKEVK